VTERPYVEHRDGTVSIDGAVKLDDWRGFLERGVWRAA
jgi:hypothetical protein